MTKTYELPNGRKMTAYFDENGIGKITVQALDSLVNELNEYASEECGHDCEHCAYLECPKEPSEDAVSRAEVLEQICWFMDNGEYFTEFSNVYNVRKLIKRVNELPSVRPQEPCEDAVSRADVIDQLHQSINILEAEDRINDLPSVQPKSETVTEFADRCRECGARYGKLLKQVPKTVCDLCVYEIPSSSDGKPCTMCPAETKRGAE